MSEKQPLLDQPSILSSPTDFKPSASVSTTKQTKKKLTEEEKKEITFNPWSYDITVWVFLKAFQLFFREIRSRGAFRIPKTGPIIFVCAPHANQFVDPMLVMQQAQIHADRRISFLVAEVSHRQKLIGSFTHLTHSIPVIRPQDNLKPASGKIFVNYDQDPLRVRGEGTKFMSELGAKGLIGLPRVGNSEISEIISDTELILRKEFSNPKARELLTQDTNYKFAAHVDQSITFRHVFNHLSQGGCVGIYPEGGSHDRSDLLPLKAGVAIMALGASAADPDCNVKIVTVGMNYFHPDKFRSRAVLEFGHPMDIPSELVEDYKAGGARKREAVKIVLENITQGLRAVTVRCPDWETLQVVQAARRLYKPAGRKTPLSLVVELNRRLLEGYNKFKDEPIIINLRKNILEYNKERQTMGIQDHQVETASMNKLQVIGKLVVLTSKLCFFAPLALPGTILFAPVFVASRVISKKKQAKALAGSTVKIQGKDVVATWKILVAMGLTPFLYTFYAILATFIAYRYHFVTESRPLWLVTSAIFVFLGLVTYSALLIGETGMDVFKSLRPLAMALSPQYSHALVKLQNQRQQLVIEVTNAVNTLGPQIYPDFRDISKETEDEHSGNFNYKSRSKQERNKASTASTDNSDAETLIDSANSNELSRISSNTSTSSLGNIPLFGNVDDESSSNGLSRVGSSASSIVGSDIEDEDYHASATGRGIFETEVSNRIREALNEDAQRRL